VADEPVVVDTNIVFSILLAPASPLRDALFRPGRRFLICETCLVELFRHREKLLKLRPAFPPSRLEATFHAILRQLDLYKENSIGLDAWNRAEEYCRDVDPQDAPHVALTLEVDGLLWTGDKRLRRGLEAKGFDRFFTPDPE